MGTKKDVFTINKLKISCKFMSINNKLFNSTLDRMDKRTGDFIGENAVLKHEVDELKKSLQFHTDQWEENFKTLDNLKNEKHHQQQQKQPVIPDLKEIKDRLNDLENRSRRHNLRIDGIIEE